METWSKHLFSGSIVVSHSCWGFISPSPLYLWITIPFFPCWKRKSRSFASFSIFTFSLLLKTWKGGLEVSKSLCILYRFLNSTDWIKSRSTLQETFIPLILKLTASSYRPCSSSKLRSELISLSLRRRLIFSILFLSFKKSELATPLLRRMSIRKNG